MTHRRIVAAVGDVLEVDGLKVTGAVPGNGLVCNANGIFVPGAGGGGGFAAGGDLSGDGTTQHVESITHAANTPIPITINGNLRAKVYPSGMLAIGADAVALADLGSAAFMGDLFALANGGSPVQIASISGGSLTYGDNSVPTKLKGNTLTFECNGQTVFTATGSGAAITLGKATSQTSFVGGSASTSVAKAVNFTASPTEARDYEITATGKTVTLASTDPIGTEYQFHNRGTGFAASATTLTPDGGKTINGQANYTFDRDYGSQYVRKTLDGNWIAGQ